jgi:hypothetical protein
MRSRINSAVAAHLTQVTQQGLQEPVGMLFGSQNFPYCS